MRTKKLHMISFIPFHCFGVFFFMTDLNKNGHKIQIFVVSGNRLALPNDQSAPDDLILSIIIFAFTIMNCLATHSLFAVL